MDWRATGDRECDKCDISLGEQIQEAMMCVSDRKEFIRQR